MTGSLKERLLRRIRLTGPITVAEYMAEALGHPEHGYYMTRDPFGARGDFVTAPEVSQMFGELIGLWCADLWRNSIAPERFRLVELGPGRGTLMSDALRAARLAPDFLEAASIHMVETSPVLAATQRETLAGHDVQWHGALGEVPDGPILLIANEFFDALPVRQFQRIADGWRERMVGLSDDGEDFCVALAPEPAVTDLIPTSVLSTARPGDVAEICPAGLAIVRVIGERIAGQGGAALIIDYGHTASAAGETLQALRGRRYSDPFQYPGEADLTAHVDFASLARAAREGGGTAHGPIAQRDFLLRLGLETRAAHLLTRATPSQADEIEAARERLIGEKEMGYLFKVMAITRKNLAPPAAFEENGTL